MRPLSPLHSVNGSLTTLATQATCELNVPGVYCHTLGMDGTQVGVLKESNKVRLTGFLQCPQCCPLITYYRPLNFHQIIINKILCYFPDKTHERCLANQQICALLISSDLTKGNGPRSIAARFPLVHFASLIFDGKLLAGSLSTMGYLRFLCVCHRDDVTNSMLAL